MPPIVGVILAGGRGTRMQSRHKPLLMLAGRPLLSHVVSLALPQVEQLVISVNSEHADYRSYRLPLVPDCDAQPSGPLVGICSAMQWYHEQGLESAWLACFPADVPVFPGTLVNTLRQALQKEPAPGCVAWCQTGDQVQPLFSLWPFAILPRMQAAIAAGLHGPRQLFREVPNRPVRLPEPEGLQFLNIDTPAELARAEQLMARQQAG